MNSILLTLLLFLPIPPEIIPPQMIPKPPPHKRTPAPPQRPPGLAFVFSSPFPIFRIDECADLKSWMPRATNSAGMTAVVIIDACSDRERQFFRVVPITPFIVK